MSQILFLCSGNTCRSPIAAGFAKKVFGPSHSIFSAGAETSNGAPIAPNAVRAAKFLDADISGQVTCDMNSLDLTKFDLISVFRPSSAERVPLPSGVPIEHLDVADPYGAGLDEYRAAARIIRWGVLRIYASDALRRSSDGPDTATSHVAGFFNRAASFCEGGLAEFLEGLGLPVRAKPTLGKLAEELERYSLANGDTFASLVGFLNTVNKPWVGVKHYPADVSTKDFIGGLEAIKQASLLFEAVVRIELGH